MLQNSTLQTLGYRTVLYKTVRYKTVRNVAQRTLHNGTALQNVKWFNTLHHKTENNTKLYSVINGTLQKTVIPTHDGNQIQNSTKLWILGAFALT
jgi:hypothetical protein